MPRRVPPHRMEHRMIFPAAGSLPIAVFRIIIAVR